jgi:hypothetical protein
MSTFPHVKKLHIPEEFCRPFIRSKNLILLQPDENKKCKCRF